MPTSANNFKENKSYLFYEAPCKHPKNTRMVYSRNVRLLKHYNINQHSFPPFTKVKRHMTDSIDRENFE